MKKILLMLFPFFLFADTSFITQKEYALQLYKNPRGIGCYHCHGDNAQGKVIAKYIHKGKDREFRAPAINNLDFKTFYKALNMRIKGMPRYFLTYKEIRTLFFYVSTYREAEKKVR